jgi:hypothetical protein
VKKHNESLQDVVEASPDGSIVRMSHDSPCLAHVVTMMCEVVGADASKLNFKTHDWFRKHTWTTPQEDEFARKMYMYLRDSREARAELMCCHYRPCAADLRKAVGEFIWMYGWMVKDKNTTKTTH